MHRYKQDVIIHLKPQTGVYREWLHSNEIKVLTTKQIEVISRPLKPFKMRQMNSWIDIEQNSDFSIYNIPFGIAEYKDVKFIATRLGNTVVNLSEIYNNGYFSEIDLEGNVFANSFLNPFIKCGKSTCKAVRERLIELFSDDNSTLANDDAIKEIALIDVKSVMMCLPVKVGDYTDFYSSIEHATNVGKMFRDPANALLPNWKHIPVGYHGRSSSIVVSETNILRPNGQTRPNDSEPPIFGPSKRVDFELEMAFITYQGKPLGESINTDEADEFIFGMCLFNDWSARDMQKWEYVPLGPFLAKNFGSSISPWIVTLEALEPFKIGGPVQEPEVLPYLNYSGKKHVDIKLEVFIQPEGSSETKVSTSNYANMYWNMNQQLAHQTINGCNINAGDMYASGTISGPTPDSYGSMLEISWSGSKPVKLEDGSERTFIEDGDTVVMRGFSQRNGIKVGFGEVRSKILPARKV